MKQKQLLFLWCWLTALLFSGNVYAQSSSVVISQVYGGGGNAGATYTHDFIELFNRSNSPVSLTGWSVQYASAAGTIWSKTDLTGTIQPGQYFLVQQAKGTGGTTALPTPDATGMLALSGTAGKVALVNNNTALSGACPTNVNVIDLVGFGTANCFEGTGATPAPSNTTAVIRASNGCTDTNNNSTDFVASAPNPRNSGSAANLCSPNEKTDPSATASANPATVAPGETVLLTVAVTPGTNPTSSGINVNGDLTSIGGPTNQLLSDDGTSGDATAGDNTYSYLATVANTTSTGNKMLSFAVNDVQSRMATTTTTLRIQSTNAITHIYTIQGSGTASPLVGETVTTTGVVVGDYQGSSSLNGFFIQDITGDNNTATSDGIFVYAPGSTDVTVGQLVQVTGTVEEAFAQTQLSNIINITFQGTGTVTPTIVNLPVSSTSSLEQLEGMLVTFPQKLTVSQNFTLARFGEVWLSADLDYPFTKADGRLYNPTNFIDPTDTPASGVENDENNKAAVTNQQDLHNLASILLDDASTVSNPSTVPYLGPDNTLRVGSSVHNLMGILNYSFSTYRLQPTQAPTFTYAPRPVAPPSVGEANLKIASFNVLNYFNGNGSGGGFPTPRGANTAVEFTRQRAKIIAAIKGLNADVIGLLEMENDGDATTSAIADLVRGLNEATGAGTYDYIRDPANGGTGTDAIKVAFIFKPGQVTPVGTTVADLNSVHNRPPLAQTFQSNATGEIVTAVINHFKSKGGTGTGPDADQNDGQANFNATRVEQAKALVSFINTTVIPAAGDEDVVLLGDFNAYSEEDPIDVLRAAGFVNLFGPESYSYVFDGQSGSLDHALASPSLYKQFTTGGKWHINADEPIFLDYNLEFKGAGRTPDYYEPNPYRSSDHDPVLVGLKLLAPTIPTISFANATATVEEGAGTYTVNLNLSEATRKEATVILSINNGAGAIYGTDYTTTPDGAVNSVTVTIPAGSTAASFTVNLTDDQLDELDETVDFTLAQVVGGAKAGGQLTSVLTIKDNDVPVISFTQPSATIIGGSSAYTITLKASIAPVSNQTITININDYDFQYGTKNDYITNPAGNNGTFTLTLPAGQTTVSFTVTANKSVNTKKNSSQRIDFTISQVSNGAGIGTPKTFVLSTGGKKESQFSQVNVYPNAATTNLTIDAKDTGSGTVGISLYDQAGMLVLSKNVNTTQDLVTNLEVGQLKRGNYILVITSESNTYKTHIILE